MKITIYILFFLSLSACSLLFPEDKYLFEVVPWKPIPCALPGAPNYSCGRVPVPKDEATNYDVIVGWKKFDDIIGKNNYSQAEAVAIYGEFAIKQVVLLGYCKEAEIPENGKNILRWEGSGEHGINVVCKK